jgi:hypothetical protein
MVNKGKKQNKNKIIRYRADIIPTEKKLILAKRVLQELHLKTLINFYMFVYQSTDV